MSPDRNGEKNVAKYIIYYGTRGRSNVFFSFFYEIRLPVNSVKTNSDLTAISKMYLGVLSKCKSDRSIFRRTARVNGLKVRW